MGHEMLQTLAVLVVQGASDVGEIAFRVHGQLGAQIAMCVQTGIARARTETKTITLPELPEPVGE
jgi:hypothetical protein